MKNDNSIKKEVEAGLKRQYNTEPAGVELEMKKKRVSLAFF